MIPAFWAVVVLCHGLDGAPPCLTHHVGLLDRMSCGPVVKFLKLEPDADRAWCTSNLPSGSTPLPAAVAATNAATPSLTCHPTAEVVAGLSERWHEAPAWMGLSNHGVLMQLWRNGDESWTLIGARPDGVSCILDAGKRSLETPAVGSRINLER